MLLVIDVGNTNTVAGIYDGKKLVEGAGNGHYHFQRSSSGTGSPVSYV